MIRRLFWLLLGAVLGVTGYRRAAALGRSVRSARPVRMVRGAGAVTGFAADVREGMALYMERQPPPAPSTLEGHRHGGIGQGRPALRNDELKDGR